MNLHLLAAACAIGAPCTPSGKIISPTPVVTGYFGHKVESDGDRILVSEFFGNHPFNSVYVFDSSSDSVVQLTVPGISPGVAFGLDIGISGNTAVVSAELEEVSGAEVGAVYVFDLPAGAIRHRLVPNDPVGGQRFGQSVAIDGDIIVVGSYGDDTAGEGAGSAYFFDAISGEQIAKVYPDPPVGTLGGWMGIDVAASGGLAAVGSTGAVYIYEIHTVVQVSRLPTTGFIGDAYGWRVALDETGTYCAVSAWSDDTAGQSAGAAYLFATDTSKQLHKLVPRGVAAGDQAGYSLALSSDFAILGCPNHNSSTDLNAGIAYVFDVNTGMQIGGVSAPPTGDETRLGHDVCLRGSEALVSSKWHSKAVFREGAVYRFDLDCLGDLDGDRAVTFADLNQVLQNWDSDSRCSDVDGSGLVEFADLNIILTRWGQVCPP